MKKKEKRLNSTRVYFQPCYVLSLENCSGIPIPYLQAFCCTCRPHTRFTFSHAMSSLLRIVVAFPFLTCRLFVVLVDLTQNQFVLATTKRVFEDGHWVQVHVRVGTLCLVGAGTVKVPYWAVCNSTSIVTVSYTTLSTSSSIIIDQLSVHFSQCPSNI